MTFKERMRSDISLVRGYDFVDQVEKFVHSELFPLVPSIDKAPVVTARGTNVEKVRTPEGKTEGSSRGITT